MTRKLASIQIIKDIYDAKNSDNLQIARVEGWQIIVAKKDNFKIGDKVVYIEIDSIVPDRKEFEFLKDRKFRVRTIKLRGNLSQGLIMPITILPKKYQNKEEEYDVTDILKIEKYEPDQSNISFDKLDSSKMKAFKAMQKKWVRKFVPNFILKFVYTNKYTKKFANKYLKRNTGMLAWPNWVAKTDEERAQNLRDDVIEKYKDCSFTVTEKVDGSSISMGIKDNTFFVCSHNYRLVENQDDKFRDQFWKTVRELDIEEKIRKYYEKIGRHTITFQGEMIGPSIQKNNYKVDSNDIYIFNIYDSDERKYFTDEEVEQICKEIGLKSVPIIHRDIKIFDYSIDEIIKMADGKSVLNPKSNREGLVFKLKDRQFSFKSVSNAYLLKLKD